MENCPVEFYDNCLSAKRCRSCAAGFKSTGELLYKPKPNSPENLITHPYAEVIKQQKEDLLINAIPKQKVNHEKAQQVKSGLKEEKNIIKDLPPALKARGTIGSGRVNGDGDLELMGFLRADSKLRTKASSFTVTSQEYKEGINSGINLWIITAQAGGTQNNKTNRMYCLTEDAFIRLCEMAVDPINNQGF
jgi:hypothetical protein